MSEANERTPLSELLAGMAPADSGFSAHIPNDWLQGRAVYGGLSAALCLQAALANEADLPPLRSAQFAFIGPAGGAVTISPTTARRGKSTAFLTVDMASDAQPAARAALCFGKARESRLDDIDLPVPAVPGPGECACFFEDRQGRNRGPNFAQHFNSRQAGGAAPMSGAAHADFTVWLKLADGDIDPPIVGLAALADALPPAAMARFDAPAPVSTMTWMFDVLSAEPTTDDGWWLCRSTAETIADGYCTQTMAIWNAAGEPVVAGRQNIAIFY